MSGLNMNRRKGSSQAVKKMIIKPFAMAPKLPENFEDDTWDKLKAATLKVHANEPVSYSQEELYRAVEDLCLHKMGAKLYERLQEVCDAHAGAMVQQIQSQSDDPSAFLGLVDTCWHHHCQQMATIRSIFLCLDRTYVIQTSSVKSLWDMGLELFKSHLVPCTEVITKLSAGLLHSIEAERQGDAVNRVLLKSLLAMCSSLSIYSGAFEEPFIEATRVFYSSEGTTLLQQSEVPDYLKHVERRLEEEQTRVLQYLDPSTRKPLIANAENELLTKHIDTVLTKGFDDMMRAKRVEDLRRLHGLFGRVDALDAVRTAFNSFIKCTGLEIVGDLQSDSTMVQRVLDFKDELDHVVKEAFDSSKSLLESCKEGFEHFINVRDNKPAELIAKFLDARLRSGGEGITEDELEVILEKVMMLFRYVQAKDVFEAFYKKDLAKRLLLSKSASADAELSMISRLKQECGSAFTVKLEGMFKDMDVSNDIMNAFRNRAQSAEEPKQEIELSVRVLTKGSWPNYPKMEVCLPAQLQVLHEGFSEFYLSRHNGCRLSYEHTLGQCTLRATFPAGRKELQVSLLQALVLLLFNDVDSLTFEEIRKGTNIDLNELKRIMQSLSSAKQKFLRKSKDGEGPESYSYNLKFASKSKKVRVDQLQIRETKQENVQTNEHIFQDRQYAIDAAIVRILKARKQLGHTMLISEIFSQLKFPAKPADIKKRIESLINRDYLERDEENTQIYKYVA